MTLPDLILALINFRKGTIATELRGFSEALGGEEAVAVTASAFCQARMKLRCECLPVLSGRAIEAFESHFDAKRWHGFRLLAADGSTGRLPCWEEIEQFFGGPSDATMPMARFSRLFDVLNKLVVQADMAPYETSEGELAARYLYRMREDDLALYDRGYAAFWLFAMHRDMDRQYCARVKLSFSKAVKDFVASGERSRVTVLTPNAQSRRQCEEYRIDSEPVPVRLVRVELGKGQVEVLATSLLDETAYPSAWFKKLYHHRWGVEEQYKVEKLRLEIENFSGRSVRVVMQDFHAKTLAFNLSSMLVWVAQAIADRLYEKRQHRYQIDFANALSVLKGKLIRCLALGSPWELLLRLLAQLVSQVQAVIPGRSYERKKRKRHERTFHENYKRTA